MSRPSEGDFTDGIENGVKKIVSIRGADIYKIKVKNGKIVESLPLMTEKDKIKVFVAVLMFFLIFMVLIILNA